MRPAFLKKAKICFVTFLAVLLCSVIAFSTVQNGVTYASTEANENQEQGIEASLPSEELNANAEDQILAIKEEYKDLQEYEYSEEIAAAMNETGMTVGESLVDQLCYYQGLLNNATDEDEILQLNGLINGTKNLIEAYQQAVTYQRAEAQNTGDTAYLSNNMLYGTSTFAADIATTAYYNAAIAAAIAWFNSANYLLSAELLTRAWEQSNGTANYYPIHGNRVVGSQITYDFIKSNKTSDAIEYPIYSKLATNTATCYEEDLGFALHHANISRSSANSTKIWITDLYDFEVQEDYSEKISDLVGVFAEAQACGLIVNYNVIINVDVADALYLKLNSTNNGVHSVTAYNYSNKPIKAVYNTKMCAPRHAQTFQNLSDIGFVTIPANSSKTVSISENLAASHITFCYIKDGYRVVTYADELYLNRSILNLTFEKTAIPANDVAIITKVGSSWLIQLTNTYSTSMKVEYNQKMCNEDDAKTWSKLLDIQSYILNPSDSKFVYISENYFATHIAVRFINNTYEYYVYANNLNANGTMTVGRRTLPVYTYLTIQNKGKSNGRWKIEITNPLSKDLTVYYNSKMCNFGDARDWVGLQNDIVTLTIPKNSSRQVEISENWFATSITISYISNGYRLITYANGLSTNGSMNIYNNRVTV